jgi:putative oligomerization/nucleic acid binding protein
MQPLSADELRINEQAATVAGSVLSEPVVAATRAQQLTIDMTAEAAGVGGFNRAMMRGMMSMTKMSKVGAMGDQMRTAGLPDSFILAVTTNQIHAIEDKRDHGELVAGKVLNSWDRPVHASLMPSMVNTAQGVPPDRQVLNLTLPMEGGGNRYLEAAARNTAAVGGMPHRFVLGTDGPSQAVVNALVDANPMASMAMGAPDLQSMRGAYSGVADAAMRQAMTGGAVAGAPAAPASDPMDQIAKLAKLRDSGVLTEDEFQAKKTELLKNI